MERIECPSCGAVTSLPPMRRSADEFCTSCDFPLFFARPEDPSALLDDVDEDRTVAAVVRRRPGAAGRKVLVGEPCPVCSELNTSQAVLCHRCGADMNPPPPPPPAPDVVEAPVAAEQVAVAESNTPPLWLVASVAALAALLTIQVMVLLFRIS